MTIWHTDKFMAIGSMTYTESREMTRGPGQVRPTGFRLNTLHCVQCEKTSTDFRAIMSRGEAHVTCPAGHEGVINMFTDEVKDSP